MRLSGMEVANATQGVWLNNVPEMIAEIGTDSRAFVAGQAFLALRGEHFDGHLHAEKVSENAVALIGDKQGIAGWKGLMATPQLEVADTLQALGDIAAAHRNSLPQTTKVIAVTGSYGKTTVRSMIAHVLESLGLKVSSTQKNFNNLIGVPKTLMAVSPDTDVAIVECGISEKGEMTRLSAIVQADVSVITGISQAHGEGLGGVDGVAREKAKLFDHQRKEGWAVLGHGVAAHFAQAECMPVMRNYSVDSDDAVHGKLNARVLTLSMSGQNADVELALPAKHWAEDMVLAATVVLQLAKDLNKAWSLQDVADALQSWQPVDGRMRIYPATEAHPFVLIDDSYNANPASMQAALDTLAALEGYRVAVIGDMLELGSDSDALHEALNLHDIDEVITVGLSMGSLNHSYPQRSIHNFADAAALMHWLETTDGFPESESTVLIKSSHGTGLYQVANMLIQRGNHAI